MAFLTNKIVLRSVDFGNVQYASANVLFISHNLTCNGGR